MAREKISSTIAAIEHGHFDPLFVRLAGLDLSGLDPTLPKFTPESCREHALLNLREIVRDDARLDNLIKNAKQTVAETYQNDRVKPVDNLQLDALRAYVDQNQGIFPSSIGKTLGSERIPMVMCDEASLQAIKRLERLSKRAGPKDAKYIYVDDNILSTDRRKQDSAASTLSNLFLSALEDKPLELVTNQALETLAGADYQKAKYQLVRKREEVQRHNKGLGRRIDMFPPQTTAVGASTNPSLTRSFYDPVISLAEMNFVLNHYTDGPEHDIIRNRFDHAMRFHRAGMDYIDQKLEERRESTRLPPPRQDAFQPFSDSGTNQSAALASDIMDEHPEDRTPLTADQVILRADRFAHRQLPNHYRLRSMLQPTASHPIILRLTDEAGHTNESIITTHQPDADLALDIKRRVQAHLLALPGVTSYRGPMKEGSYNVAIDEMVPAAVPRDRITPKYGEYRLKLQWHEQQEEITISLGLNYTAGNFEEAERRAQFVCEQLALARQANPDQSYLPLTKRDLIDALREHVLSTNQPWQELTHGEIEHFPAALRLPFSGRGHDQESWLQVDPLKTDGNPNYTWVLPMQVIVNGQRLANASTHVNLHVRDRKEAEDRAIATVDQFMAQLTAMPRHTQWAIDHEHPERLQTLSEAARDAALHLLDTNRLKDIQNELRSTFKKDLRVKLVAPPTEESGWLLFRLGVFRGGENVRGAENDQLEPILEQVPGNPTPQALQRFFRVPTKHAEDIARFELRTNDTFRAVIGEEYDPRSDRNYDHEQMRKIKTPRPFMPGYAPRVFDDAIGTRLAEFAEIIPERPNLSHTRRRNAPGGRNPRPDLPHQHHREFGSDIGSELDGGFADRAYNGRGEWRRE